MGTIVVLGQRLERRAFAWSTIFAACWAMTIWDPQTLWDLGFQLSASYAVLAFLDGWREQQTGDITAGRLLAYTYSRLTQYE